MQTLSSESSQAVAMKKSPKWVSYYHAQHAYECQHPHQWPHQCPSPTSAPSPPSSQALAPTPAFPSAHAGILVSCKSTCGCAAVAGHGDSPQAQGQSLSQLKSAQCSHHTRAKAPPQRARDSTLSHKSIASCDVSHVFSPRVYS